MTRSVLSVAALVLLGLVGLWATWGMYDLASIYGDPTGSELSMFVPFGPVVMIAVVLMVGIGASAVALARGGRRVAAVTAALIIGTSLVGIVVASHYGLEDKRADTAEPPPCGIENGPLRQEFERIDHPGYFGGGSGSRTDCSYLLDTGDVPSALAEYDRRLSDRGYAVTRTSAGLTATHDNYRFTARVDEAVQGDGYLTVTLSDLD